jgi:hypothetical protein
VVDLEGELASAPRLVRKLCSAAALDEFADAVDDLVLAVVRQVGIQHEQDLVRVHVPDDLPSFGLAAPPASAARERTARGGAGSAGECSIARMRVRLAWLVGLGGAAALTLRAVLGRRARPAVPPADDPRARELRRRLDESRSLVDEREEFEERELPVDRVDAGGDPDERRRRVHEEGRSAVDEMRGGPPG